MDFNSDKTYPYVRQYNTIIFHGRFNSPLTDKILEEMKTCKCIYFGSDFNQKIDNLPFGIEKIRLSMHFNLPIDNLPMSLLTLDLGPKFNQSIDNLPHRLETLRTYVDFNQPVDNLPSSLRDLKLSGHFNQPIDFLPCNLQLLEVGQKFNQRLDNLPDSLIELKIDNQYYDKDLMNLPRGLQNLFIHSTINVKMPDNCGINYFYSVIT